MSHHAANAAAQPHLRLSIFSAPALNREVGDEPCETAVPFRTVASESSLPVGAGFATGIERVTSVQLLPSVPYPVLCPATASGLIWRPAARRRSASALRPYGLRFPAAPDPP